MRWCDRFTALVREGGISYLLLQMARRFSSPVLDFGSITLFMRRLDNEVPAPNHRPDIHWRWALPSDLGYLGEERRGIPSKAVLDDRLARGERCALAIDTAGKLAYSRWVTMGGRGYIPEVDMDVVPTLGVAYHYDGYTRPDFRRHGIDAMGRAFILRALRDAGLKKACWYVRGNNPIALRISRRWGRPIGRLWYVRLFDRRPIVIGRHARGPVTLMNNGSKTKDNEERDFRVRAWSEWFNGWLNEPLEKRSTGYHALTEEQFYLTAEHIASILSLNPKSDLVLDLGCDSAMASRFVAPRCRGFVGVDFISAMLRDIDRKDVRSADGHRVNFAAADGRALPFSSGVFTKAYCSAVIHTLPSHEDAFRVISELARVCRPGGEVLIASVPDIHKIPQARMLALRNAKLIDKAKLVVLYLIPRPIKNILRRFFRLGRRNRLEFLEFDLRGLKRSLEKEDLECEVLDYPKDYWSEDFRTTRSNLVIRIPQSLRRKSQHLYAEVRAMPDDGGDS